MQRVKIPSLPVFFFSFSFCVKKTLYLIIIKFQGMWLAVYYWCHTFMCMCFINSGSSLSWQRKLMISFMVPTKPDWSGLVWFCQLKTNPVTLSLFSHHHGTGPWCEYTLNKTTHVLRSSIHWFIHSTVLEFVWNRTETTSSAGSQYGSLVHTRVRLL